MAPGLMATQAYRLDGTLAGSASSWLTVPQPSDQLSVHASEARLKQVDGQLRVAHECMCQQCKTIMIHVSNDHDALVTHRWIVQISCPLDVDTAGKRRGCPPHEVSLRHRQLRRVDLRVDHACLLIRYSSHGVGSPTVERECHRAWRPCREHYHLHRNRGQNHIEFESATLRRYNLLHR